MRSPGTYSAYGWQAGVGASQTRFYRIGKFVRRNRKAVIVGVLVNVAIVATLGYAAWRQQQAIREGQRALRMQTFMYRLFKLANSNYTGSLR